MQAYLSSSPSELAAHRQAAEEAIQSLGWQVSHAVERHHLRENLAETSLHALNHCQLFVGIYAVHYGDKLPHDEVSLLEKLYLAASEADLPRLIYVVGARETWATDQLHTDERGAWMRMFMDKIHQDNPHLRYFSTPQDLAEKIRFDLARLPNPKPIQSKRVRRRLFLGMLVVVVWLGIISLLVAQLLR